MTLPLLILTLIYLTLGGLVSVYLLLTEDDAPEDYPEVLLAVATTLVAIAAWPLSVYVHVSDYLERQDGWMARAAAKKDAKERALHAELADIEDPQGGRI
tara:strand:+ start:1620 stop:1919 length:300 start_codon:yes stop_codon:yes gene_type:complete